MRPNGKIKPDAAGRRARMILVALGAVVLMMGASCPPPGGFPEPDLIPEGRPGAEGPNAFCDRNDAGDLVVRVRNQTNNDVLVATNTRVTFGPDDPPCDLSTSPLPGGSSFTGTCPIPSGCFNPDCGFQIEVDQGGVVDESHGAGPDNHETNNTAQGICIG